MEISQTLDIVLVEDDMTDAELAIRALSKNNLINNITHLKGGKEALDYLFEEITSQPGKLKNTPSLLLLDLKMPGMSGFEVLTAVKGDDRTRTIPVVVLTSSKDHPDVEACYRLGVNSYIVKPVEFDNFSKAVNQIGFYWLLLNHPPVL